MARSRVLSFISQFSGNRDSQIYNSTSHSPSTSFPPPSESQAAPSAHALASHMSYSTSDTTTKRPAPPAVAAATAALNNSYSSASMTGSSQSNLAAKRKSRLCQDTPSTGEDSTPATSPEGVTLDPIEQASPQKQGRRQEPPTRDEDHHQHQQLLGHQEGSSSRSPSRHRSTAPHSQSHSRSPSRRRQSRPLSMVHAYQSPLMDLNQDTIPELLPIFTFLNGHANKLYHEGYFLKLDDQDTQGRPNPDRTWTEYFVQLVGTVLSLWDAAELDAAGEDGEVMPKFINLTDASMQIIESLPTKSGNPHDQPLQNILSISTAGRNRYLLHFNSHHSLVQWAAAIRLAMYEQASLQEAYTGALIAGKGKSLNNINLIMERSRHKIEEWVRVRFGAGTPWRRCWCVISPPDEKEYQKIQKEWKKRSPYDRSSPPILKGDIKFFDTKISSKKQKKVTPLATVTDCYSAYAIYPQAKSLMDASTLVKLEGNITYYLDPPSSKEGFVFVMPEVPPAVSGFEMLLRFLFPTWDTFGLYGRPGRLVASVLDQRSLMFAMPKHKRYGYLEVLDLSGLILTDGSKDWNEREWRRRMKELTSHRMNTIDDASSSTHSRSGSKRSNRLSMGPVNTSGPLRPRVNFAGSGAAATRSGRSMTVSQAVPRTDSAPPASREIVYGHSRNASDPNGMPIPHNPLGYAGDFSPSHSPARAPTPSRGFHNDLAATPEGQSSDEDVSRSGSPVRGLEDGARDMLDPDPVTAPPAFAHDPTSKPIGKPYYSPELRKANARLSHSTLAHIMAPGDNPMNSQACNRNARWDSDDSPVSSSGYSDRRAPVVHPLANSDGIVANSNGSREALNTLPLQGAAAQLRSPIHRRPVPMPGHQEPEPQVFTADSRNFSSSPSSRSNSWDSQKQVVAFHRPLASPVPSHSSSAASMAQRNSQSAPQGMDERKSLESETFEPDANLAGLVVDPSALDRINSRESSETHGLNRTHTLRSATTSSHDNASTISADYASTVHSDEAPEPVEKPRAGVLRTVGDSNHDTTETSLSDMPEINFGPTFSLSRPLISHAKSLSHGSAIQGASRPFSPHQKPSTGRKTPSADSGHNRQKSDDTLRRVAWHAGAASPGVTPSGKVVTPEEFVHQRAAQNYVFQHHRQPSGNTLSALRTGNATPPLNRAVTSDPVTRPAHSRSGSADLLQRPASRGAGSVLNVGTGLSAREQEHIARMTGSSLLQVDGRRPEPQSSGLVGAIAQREKEKEQLKQGYGSQAVQQAIHQRQQAQAQQAYQQQMQQQQIQQQQIQQQQQLYQQQYQQQQLYGVPNASSPSIYSQQTTQPRYQSMQTPSHMAAPTFTQGGGWTWSNIHPSPGSSYGATPK